MATATFTLPLLVLATTDSATLTGLAFALEWVPRLASFRRAGALVARHGAGQVMRMAAAIRALVLLAAILVLAGAASGAATTATVMALAVLNGVLSQFSYVAAETAGATASQATTRPHRVQGVLLGIDQGAMLAGPAAGAALLQWAGPGSLLGAVAAMSATAAATVPTGLASRGPGFRDGAAAPAVSGWATLKALPALAWLIAGLAVSNLATGTLEAAAPVIVVRNWGHSSASVGAVWSVAAAATLLVVAASRPAIDRWGLWPVGALSAAVASAACLGVAQAHGFPAYTVLVAVLMASEAGMTVVLRTLRSQLVPEQAFAPTLAVTILILLLPFPLAGVLVACTPPAALGQLLTGLAVLQAIALAAAFAKARKAFTPHRAASSPG
ncbi:MFS transporter [Streptomyces sp. V4-01]|uniref:MFS transporter n=1 Tax=Actinacidiphila polyblastidii TaxID=3110430 RepID=A0ABU7PDU4_9ACTN|nr:MFS transporter [Streptomyces sp. V4-01]